ncbi:MAG: primosomal protein N' [Tidjanibacter sp.]|nr:primosomal protein N' [Tidjanibacter sp.]
MEQLFADIILPLAIQPLTFVVGEEWREQISVGSGVAVPLGKQKVYTGIVCRLHHNTPPYKRIREISGIVRSEPLASVGQIALWEWCAEYYMCTIGEIMRIALPSLLKPSAESDDLFSERVFSLGKEQWLRLGEGVRTEEALSCELEKLLPRRKAQYSAMMEFCGLTEEMGLECGEVPRSALGASTPVIAKLIEGGLLESFTRERTPHYNTAHLTHNTTLTEAQEVALSKVREGFTRHHTMLLHGITGSGKTELYIRLANEQLRAGRSVLYLIPELALSEQLIGRLKEAFGDGLTIYHSRMTARARTEIYIKLSRSEGGEIIVGTRSAVLLPLNNLGLVIVDEEHDTNFKQEDPAPRFSARDVAVWMAHNLGCKTLLGSATPSMESFYNAYTGRYGYAWLGERYGSGKLPRVTVSDTIKSAKRGERRDHIGKELSDAIKEALAEGRQVMLFQNRRGFAPYIECPTCGWSARCPHCGVTLTYYKKGSRLRCNLCGYAIDSPTRCPSCHEGEPLPQGFGTEKIEEVISEMFPEAKVVRLDGDIATSGGRMRSVIRSFESGEADILVGTGMITKGFDFTGVKVVGVLNADNLLSRPDFRAEERTFQTIVQITGRAGRNDAEGHTIIQTAQPDNHTIIQAARGDYLAMARTQLRDREAFSYPPFVRLIKLTLRHTSPELVVRGARHLAQKLRQMIGKGVSDAHAPAVSQIADNYYMQILVRIERSESPADTKCLIRSAVGDLLRDKIYRHISLVIDVDPQ